MKEFCSFLPFCFVKFLFQKKVHFPFPDGDKKVVLYFLPSRFRVRSQWEKTKHKTRTSMFITFGNIFSKSNTNKVFLILSIVPPQWTCKIQTENNYDVCCIFRPAFGCCALQTLVEIVFFSVFAAKNLKKGRILQQISVKNSKRWSKYTTDVAEITTCLDKCIIWWFWVDVTTKALKFCDLTISKFYLFIWIFGWC